MYRTYLLPCIDKGYDVSMLWLTQMTQNVYFFEVTEPVKIAVSVFESHQHFSKRRRTDL